jgi:hypothetical protein
MAKGDQPSNVMSVTRQRLSLNVLLVSSRCVRSAIKESTPRAIIESIFEHACLLTFPMPLAGSFLLSRPCPLHFARLLLLPEQPMELQPF